MLANEVHSNWTFVTRCRLVVVELGNHGDSECEGLAGVHLLVWEDVAIALDDLGIELHCDRCFSVGKCTVWDAIEDGRTHLGSASGYPRSPLLLMPWRGDLKPGTDVEIVANDVKEGSGE